jgi:hypothetical protein
VIKKKGGPKSRRSSFGAPASRSNAHRCRDLVAVRNEGLGHLRLECSIPSGFTLASISGIMGHVETPENHFWRNAIHRH